MGKTGGGQEVVVGGPNHSISSADMKLVSLLVCIPFVRIVLASWVFKILAYVGQPLATKSWVFVIGCEAECFSVGAFTSWSFRSFQDKESGEAFSCWVQKRSALEFCMMVCEGRTTLKQQDLENFDVYTRGSFAYFVISTSVPYLEFLIPFICLMLEWFLFWVSRLGFSQTVYIYIARQ